MKKFLKISLIPVSLGLFVGAALASPALAQASDLSPSPSVTDVEPEAVACGYTGNHPSHDSWYVAGYNHCGTGNVKVQIDYFIGNDTKCVGPGLSTFQNNAINQISNIFYIGSC